jgi:hypothetical protein
MRNRATAALSLLMVGLGLVVIARTVAAGVGGGLGLVLGGMLVAAGALRFYLSTRSVGSRPGKARSAPKRRAS